MLLAFIVSYLIGMAVLFKYSYDAVEELEASAIMTMETWCGPETTKRFKEVRGLSCE
jgi:hypothetical protein